MFKFLFHTNINSSKWCTGFTPISAKTNATLDTFEISEQEIYDILSSSNVDKASGPKFVSC